MFTQEHWFTRWITRAKEDKYKFIISVCDTWDYEDYPVYCKNEKELIKKRQKYDGTNMQTINEIIKVDNYTINKDGSVKLKELIK